MSGEGYITSAREIADRLISRPQEITFDQRPGFLDPSGPPVVQLIGAIGERTAHGWRIGLQMTIDGKPMQLLLHTAAARQLGLELGGLADMLDFGIPD
jgi:hypothetical protein